MLSLTSHSVKCELIGNHMHATHMNSICCYISHSHTLASPHLLGLRENLIYTILGLTSSKWLISD